MFGIGLPEMILIVAVALIVVGPDKLPELAKTLAKQMVELKKAANSLKDNLNEQDLAVINTDDVPTSHINELTSQSPQALPGDQWVHDQDADAINEMQPRKILPENDFTAINSSSANKSISVPTPS